MEQRNRQRPAWYERSNLLAEPMRFRSYGIVVAILVSTLAPSALAQTGTVVGSVKTSDGGPVVGRAVTLSTEWDTVRTVTTSNGSFRFDKIADGRYELRILMPGRAPWSTAIDIRGGITVSVHAILRPTFRQLPTVRVTGLRTGVFGEIGDLTNYKPLDSARVEVIGFRAATTTSNGGRFSLDSVAAGRSYVVRISRRGYQLKTVSIRVPERGGFELNAYLEPGIDRSAKDELLWREFDNRANYGGNNAALITRADLVGGPHASLASALALARPLLMKGLRLHWDALSRPGTAVYPCIFVNGRAAPQGVLLDQFELGDIEAIEVYGPGSLQYERLAGKFAAPPLPYACGARPSRYIAFEKTSIRIPLGDEMGSAQMISVLVIWLRQ
jgi:hypothetical protein